jgi:hypothetical protein
VRSLKSLKILEALSKKAWKGRVDSLKVFEVLEV